MDVMVAVDPLDSGDELLHALPWAVWLGARIHLRAVAHASSRRPRASYETRPDKETPLWDPFTPVIYWWTDTEVDDAHAYMIVYHGGVFSKPKTMRTGSLGFRAVRTPRSQGPSDD